MSFLQKSGVINNKESKKDPIDRESLEVFAYCGIDISKMKNPNELIGKKAWVPDVAEGYILGIITELMADTFTIETINQPKRQITALFSRSNLAGEDVDKDVEDNCALMNLDDSSLLNNIHLRYKKDCIYTYVANILIAVNPYKEISALYTSDVIKKYQGKSIGTMPPHVYAIGDKAYREMKMYKMSQSIIVSGESGAGKTESAKYLLRYLTESYGVKSGLIETRINESNPLLEAFGNAKTLRNNNSSRFGKFIELHFNKQNRVAGGFISHYLLEKSRICVQNEAERNYHIFYRLCAGAPDKLRNSLGLKTPDDYHYLNRGCTQYFSRTNNLPANRKSRAHAAKGALKDTQLDDVEDFIECDKALDQIGLSASDKMDIYGTVATVLHLGNIEFEENHDTTSDGCQVCPKSMPTLNVCAEMLGLQTSDLETSLISRIMNPKGANHSSIIHKSLKENEAQNARDALAKAIYVKLFDYIVACVNKAIPFDESNSFIGILDIAGFEYFTTNGFEQFCINYCNEKLQAFFNQRILKDEQDLYDRERLNYTKITIIDNQACIELFEAKKIGIFDLLDEENKVPTPRADNFTKSVLAKNHPCLDLTRVSKVQKDRNITCGFLIRHFAGSVCYETNQFIDKNVDALHASLAVLVKECTNEFIKNLFSDLDEVIKNSGRLTFESVSSKFRGQLNGLLEKLKSTGTSFIRCIKPNAEMVPRSFQGGLVLSQLRCSGTMSVLNLMCKGFPSRTSPKELYAMYEKYLPKELKSLDPIIFCRALFQVLRLQQDDFQFGTTKVFFRPKKFAEFDQIMRSDPESLKSMVVEIKRLFIRIRWRRTVNVIVGALASYQRVLKRKRDRAIAVKQIHMWVVRRKYRPRIKGLKKIKTLQNQLEETEHITSQLKADKEKSMKRVQVLKQKMEAGIYQLKNNDKITPDGVKALCDELYALFDSEVKLLKGLLEKQKNREEQERLRKVQEELDKAKKQKEQEELQKILEADQQKQRIEMENRRKQEEELAKQTAKETESLVAELVKKRNIEREEEDRQQYMLQQDQCDLTLASLLASEMNSQVVQTPSLIQKTDAKQSNKKHDLSKWKYAELRDTINTSCDVELLEACREEFHRRLKVYHAWKSKNKNKQADKQVDDERAPSSITENPMIATLPRTQSTSKVTKGEFNEQRFFRIPFVRPAEQNRDANGQHKKGWWYAHFDGKWIARQMEIHENKPPILLLAGVDDMNMCELSLEETGLTKKRGAEILECEFEEEWVKNGGNQYLSQHFGQISSKYVLSIIQRNK